MTAEIALIRHGPTAWNRSGRLQGRRDEPLDPEGRAEIAGYDLPSRFAGWRALTSPLLRAVETADLLGRGDALREPALIEMDFGAYEGLTLAECRARFGNGFAENEARGLDFTPPGGESPRTVQHRLAPLLRDLAAAAQPTLCFCHKGVIRALYAWATDWPMIGKPPHRLDWRAAHLFSLDPAGVPSVGELNIPLDRRPG